MKDQKVGIQILEKDPKKVNECNWFEKSRSWPINPMNAAFMRRHFFITTKTQFVNLFVQETPFRICKKSSSGYNYRIV
jgi:hypothetical protein